MSEVVNDLRRQKQINEEQREILKDQERAMFYVLLQMKLNADVNAQFTIYSGKLKREQGITGSAVKYFADFFLGQVGVILAESIMNKEMDRNNIIHHPNPSALYQFNEEVARQLAQIDEVQLKQCAKDGAKRLAEIAFNMIGQAHKHIDPNSREQTLAEQMITAVVTSSVNDQKIKVSNARIKTKPGTHRGSKWTALGVFLRSGVKNDLEVELEGMQNRKDKYGSRYRWLKEKNQKQANTPTNQIQSQQMGPP